MIKQKEKIVKLIVCVKESDVRKLNEIKAKSGRNKSEIVRTLIRDEYSLMV